MPWANLSAEVEAEFSALTSPTPFTPLPDHAQNRRNRASYAKHRNKEQARAKAYRAKNREAINSRLREKRRAIKLALSQALG